jgi:hypothetical protein
VNGALACNVPPVHDMCAQKVGEWMKMELVEKHELQVN